MNKVHISLSTEEKLMLDKIHVITEIPKVIIKKVFLGLLLAHTIEYYDENELIIPYICKLGVNVISKIQNKTVEGVVALNATPNEALTDEIIAICNGETTKSEKYNKDKILKKIQEILEINSFDPKSFVDNLL